MSNPHGRSPERHMIDGREMTVTEIAAMLGISVQSLQVRKCRLGGPSYQAIVDMYRSNQFGRRDDRAHRYLIYGAWMTYAQIARRLGIARHSLVNYRCRTRCSMEEAIEHFRAYNACGRKHNPSGRGGRRATLYRVRGHDYTVPGIAKKYGVALESVRGVLKSRSGDMGAVIDYYEAKADRKLKRAKAEIMRILGF